MSSGKTPAFCGSAPVLTWTRRRSRPALLRHLGGDRRGDLVAVDGVDRIEQRHGLRRLVGLERADQVEVEVREVGAERRPLALGFLDAVLAEHPLAGLDHRQDRPAIRRSSTPRSAAPTRPGGRPPSRRRRSASRTSRQSFRRRIGCDTSLEPRRAGILMRARHLLVELEADAGPVVERDVAVLDDVALVRR